MRNVIVPLLIVTVVGPATAAIIDANTNGLSDVFEFAYYGGWADPNGDDDGDGLSNYQEMLWGTNPRRYDAPAAALQLGISGRDLTFSWTSAYERQYFLSSSTDLSIWSAGTEVSNSVVIIPNGLSLAAPVSLFWRLQVVLRHRDTDGDGLEDWEDFAYQDVFGSHPQLADSDGDGIHDGTEFATGTFFNGRDADADGLDDRWEMLNGFDTSKKDNPAVGLVVFTPLE